MRQVPPCKCIEERTVALFSIRIVAKRPDKWLQELPPHLLLSWVLSSDWESFPRYQEKTLNLRNREIWEEGKDRSGAVICESEGLEWMEGAGRLGKVGGCLLLKEEEGSSVGCGPCLSPRLLRCPGSPCRGSIRARGPSWGLGTRRKEFKTSDGSDREGAAAPSLLSCPVTHSMAEGRQPWAWNQKEWFSVLVLLLT